MNLGVNEIKIQLKPAELGRMLMTIDNTGNSMKVSIMAENQTAKDILISNAGELKAVLSNSGINLESFEVDLGSDFRQSMADARNQAGQFGRNNRGQGSGSGENNGNTEQPAEITDTASAVNTDGSLHYVA